MGSGSAVGWKANFVLLMTSVLLFPNRGWSAPQALLAPQDSLGTLVCR